MLPVNRHWKAAELPHTHLRLRNMSSLKYLPEPQVWSVLCVYREKTKKSPYLTSGITLRFAVLLLLAENDPLYLWLVWVGQTGGLVSSLHRAGEFEDWVHVTGGWTCCEWHKQHELLHIWGQTNSLISQIVNGVWWQVCNGETRQFTDVYSALMDQQGAVKVYPPVWRLILTSDMGCILIQVLQPFLKKIIWTIEQ